MFSGLPFRRVALTSPTSDSLASTFHSGTTA